jgi:hypothetical protein
MVAAVRVRILNMMPERSRHQVKQAPQVGMYCMVLLLPKRNHLGTQEKQTVTIQEKEKEGSSFLVQRQRHYWLRRGYHGLGKEMKMMVFVEKIT